MKLQDVFLSIGLFSTWPGKNFLRNGKRDSNRSNEGLCPPLSNILNILKMDAFHASFSEARCW